VSITAYIGIDDTDNLESTIGTGKLARRFEALLPAGNRLWGVVRQQLLVDPRIPYTSHNSSACLVVICHDVTCLRTIRERAVPYLEREAAQGSDPGLCIAAAGDEALDGLIAFGGLCTRSVVTKGDARRAAAGVHLSSHGGTGDGIIGAAAAVGLTASGWSGRFIEYNGLRNFANPVTVAELAAAGITVVSVDRDALTPMSSDRIDTGGWLRPRLLGHQAVLPVLPDGSGPAGGRNWRSFGGKRNQHNAK
jgi:tRNA(Ile2) C34 agmatinyltransferase TiaS